MRAYGVNIRREIRRVWAFVVRVLNIRDGCHEAHARRLVQQIVEREFEVRGRDQPHEDVVPDDGKTAIQLTCSMEKLKLHPEAGCGYERRVCDIDDASATHSRYDVSQIRRENGLVLLVEERVRIHIRQQILLCC